MFLKCVIPLISLGRPDQREKKKRGHLQPISGMKRDITVDVSDGEPIREYCEWLYWYIWKSGWHGCICRKLQISHNEKNRKLLYVVILINMFVYK